jgi:hypothetical protein
MLCSYATQDASLSANEEHYRSTAHQRLDLGLHWDRPIATYPAGVVAPNSFLLAYAHKDGHWQQETLHVVACVNYLRNVRRQGLQAYYIAVHDAYYWMAKRVIVKPRPGIT